MEILFYGIAVVIVIGWIWGRTIGFKCERCNNRSRTLRSVKHTGRLTLPDKTIGNTVLICENCEKQLEQDYEHQQETHAKSPLIACPDCGKTISKRAAACPNCGCPSSVPKCPTCSSANIKKISAAKKAAYVAGVGILSPAFKSVRSTFQCNECGYKW